MGGAGSAVAVGVFAEKVRFEYGDRHYTVDTSWYTGRNLAMQKILLNGHDGLDEYFYGRTASLVFSSVIQVQFPPCCPRSYVSF